MPGEDLRVKNRCSQVPSLVGAFVDTFVDFAVGGQFLAPQPSKSPSQQKESISVVQEQLGALTVSEKEQEEPHLTTRIPAPERLIAIGDIHGDLGKAKEALRIAKVMDEEEKWIGGDTVVVQVGDLLDRGPDEIKVIYLLEKLKQEARKDGGDVHIMNGNHEIMNIEGDFRYATMEGMEEFQHWAEWHKMGNVLKERCKGLKKPYDFFKNIPEHFSEGFKARMAALRPGGPISSRFLASHPTVLVVGGTVFVHGGLLPTHLAHGLEKINEETQQWILGEKGWLGPDYLHGRDALVWLRKYSEQKESACDCHVLEKTLNAVTGAKRMVVGHTIQNLQGINAVCSNKVVRVDVGMSKGCGNGSPQVLEIQNDKGLIVLSATSSLKLEAESIAPNHGVQQERPGLASLLSPKSSEVKMPVNLQTAQNI